MGACKIDDSGVKGFRAELLESISSEGAGRGEDAQGRWRRRLTSTTYGNAQAR